MSKIARKPVPFRPAGHSTLEMTKRYVHLASRDVAEQHKKFSPMTALLGKGPDAISSRAGAYA